MESAVKVVENENYRFSIFHDTDPLNPRTDYDHAGLMVCGHRRYRLGDEQSSNEFNSWAEVKADILRQHRDAIILPLRLYDHSGISMSTTTSYPYNDQWDSGQVGWIYTTKEMMTKLWGDSLPRCWKKKAVEVLISEVEEYDTYLRGEVYGFKLEKKSVCNLGHTHYEVEESGWSFMGDWEKSGILDELPEELKQLNKKAV